MPTSSSHRPPTLRLPLATASLYHHHHSSFLRLSSSSKPKFKPLPSLSLSSLHAPPPTPLLVTCKKSSKAAAVSEELWEKLILKSAMPVLVEFYASWCGPCQMVHRVIDEIAGEYDGKLSCFVLNTDTDLQIAKQYEIKAVPVVLVFKNGEKKETIVGTMPKEFYIAAIERVLKL